MIKDPIVEEVHETREHLLQKYGGFKGVLHHIREIEAELKGRVVRLEPRRPIETKRKIS
jgi:hypothetical protein